MFVYNNNYKRQIKKADLERLTRLKRAADVTYKYYEWLSANPLSLDKGSHHELQITGLRQDVKSALFLGEEQEILVNYFIACVLFAIYNSHQEGAPQGTPCPIERSQLDFMFDPAKVQEQLASADYKLLSYSSGIFLLSDNSPSEVSAMELIRTGALVMADSELIDTVNLNQVLVDNDIDLDDTLEEDQVGAIFLKELVEMDNSFPGNHLT